MTNTNLKPIAEIADNFSFYVKGDMKKFYRALKDEGYDIISITHNPNSNGWGVAVTTVMYANPNFGTNPENPDDDTVYFTEEVVWG